MIRLLAVLAIIALAAVFLGTQDRDGNVQRPEQQYIEQTGKAEALGEQMQQQAEQQMRDIDAKTE